jgi:hypothetical protein
MLAASMEALPWRHWLCTRQLGCKAASRGVNRHLWPRARSQVTLRLEVALSRPVPLGAFFKTPLSVRGTQGWRPHMAQARLRRVGGTPFVDVPGAANPIELRSRHRGRRCRSWL